MILIIDNYDSFTYNLYQYIGTIDPSVAVVRNDKTTADEIKSQKPEKIILSPGPGFPSDAGICIDVIKQLGGEIPILGVCLGHQAIGEAFGGKIIHAPHIMHGKADTADIDQSCPIYKGLPPQIEVGRYHSLVIDPETLPQELAVTAKTSDGCIMSVMHKTRPIYGIQFHPESVLTPDGYKIIENFLSL